MSLVAIERPIRENFLHEDPLFSDDVGATGARNKFPCPIAHIDSQDYSRMRCLRLIPTLKICVICTECCVVATGVTVMFDLCNPPYQGVNNLPNLG
jgi:hypothetical protein